MAGFLNVYNHYLLQMWSMQAPHRISWLASDLQNQIIEVTGYALFRGTATATRWSIGPPCRVVIDAIDYQSLDDDHSGRSAKQAGSNRLVLVL